MLLAAFAILCAAVLLGSTLAILGLRGPRAALPVPLTAVHGLFALGGFVCLLIGLQGPPRGAAEGVGSFGMVAAAMLALALAAGGCALGSRLLKTPLTGLLVGVHATLAVAGFVFLTAYLFA